MSSLIGGGLSPRAPAPLRGPQLNSVSVRRNILNQTSPSMIENRIIGLILVMLLAAAYADTLWADTDSLYVDSRIGSETNPGTPAKPLKTIQEAAARLSQTDGRGSFQIRIAPGIYTVSQAVEFNTQRQFSDETRLTIEASILPDDPKWQPGLMPIIVPTEETEGSERSEERTESWTFRVNVNHVTIRGLNFLGNARVNNYHGVIERIGKNRDDLLVTQCLFLGSPTGLDIYCPVIGTGDRLVVEHCIFYKCHNAVVFWDGKAGVGGKGNAVRHCIITGADVSAVWTCQTEEDLAFESNIVTDCRFLWMRKPGDGQRYSVRNCVITGCDSYAGEGKAFGPLRSLQSSKSFTEENVTKQGHVVLVEDKTSRDYLHVVPGTLGSRIGAGLFKTQASIDEDTDNQTFKPTR